MPKTPATDTHETVAPERFEMPVPHQGGSYVFDPVTGQSVREGGTKPQTELNPNPAFDAPEA